MGVGYSQNEIQKGALGTKMISQINPLSFITKKSRTAAMKHCKLSVFFQLYFLIPTIFRSLFIVVRDGKVKTLVELKSLSAWINISITDLLDESRVNARHTSCFLKPGSSLHLF